MGQRQRSFTEAVPRVGRLLLYAAQRCGTPLIESTALVIVVIFTISNLIAEIPYAYLNPRIRYTT
jgi:ABC-type dipeptide/oligopeptide/nickel transport system permease component